MKLEDFGFTEGINEVIAVTIGGFINTAPLGIIVENPKGRKAKVRLYPSHTRENVKRGSKIYANVVSDPIIFAISAFEDLTEDYFSSLDPPVLKSALAYCEFEAKLTGAFAELELVDGRVISKELRAVNRGFYAVIEALVYATRYLFFKDPEKKKEFRGKILHYFSIKISNNDNIFNIIQDFQELQVVLFFHQSSLICCL